MITLISNLAILIITLILVVVGKGNDCGIIFTCFTIYLIIVTILNIIEANKAKEESYKYLAPIILTIMTIIPMCVFTIGALTKAF